MKTVLAFPPFFITYQPYSSMPTLAAYLARRGHESVKVDANVDFICDHLTVEHIKKIATETTARYEELAGKENPTDRDKFLARYLMGCFSASHFQMVLPDLESSLELIRDPGKAAKKYAANHARDVLIKAQNLVLQHLRFKTIQRTRQNDFSSCLTWEEIEKEVYSENEYADYYRIHTIPRIAEARPGLVGVSVVIEDQLVPAFILARVLRETPELAEVPIAFGGPVFTVLQEVLKKNPGPFSLVDYFGIHEGEEALAGLLDHLEGKTPLAEVPNLIHRKNGETRVGPRSFIHDLDTLPTPDFSGLPLDRYLSPAFVPILKVSRGCYWNKCGFCNNRYLTRGAPHRPRSPEKVFEDFVTLNERHGASLFTLWDECVPPKLLSGLARAVRDSGRDFKWFAEVRFEKLFTLDFLRDLHDGGCRALTFGLESGSPRMQEWMKKGYDIGLCERILRDCAKVGIRVYMCLMVGFPGERPGDVMETMRFLDRNNRYLFHAGVSHFGVRRFTDVYDDPARYGVAIKDDSASFSSTGDVNYEVVGNGMKLSESTFFYNKLREKLVQMGLMQNEPESHYLVQCPA